MILTRVLLQAAAAEHHTPLIRFLGKRSPTSMLYSPRTQPPFPHPSCSASPSATCVGVNESLEKKNPPFSNTWGYLLPQILPIQPRTHILPHPPTPCPTHLSNTDPKRKITGLLAVIVPAPPPPPPRLHQQHQHHHLPHLCHIMAP